MNIQVVHSIGTGSTVLSAFDTALKNVGVLDYNLIPLSSVIPPHTQVIPRKYYETHEEPMGKRLYVVMAKQCTDNIDNIIGSGVGWYMFEQGGVFVEHEVEGYSIQEVEDELMRRIESSLTDLCHNRGREFTRSQMTMSLSVCPSLPSPRCALVLAVYKTEPW